MKLQILFLCTDNSCRSQMAEGWARHLKGEEIEAYSAGLETHGVNPFAVQVMAEAGVDISKHYAKPIDIFSHKRFDAIITVCDHAHENWPYFPGQSKRVHKGFSDPPRIAKAVTDRQAYMEKQLNCYRLVRDEIRDFIETLPEGLASICSN